MQSCYEQDLYFYRSGVFGENVVKSFNHWHSLPVLDLAFTAQGMSVDIIYSSFVFGLINTGCVQTLTAKPLGIIFIIYIRI